MIHNYWKNMQGPINVFKMSFEKFKGLFFYIYFNICLLLNILG